MATEAEVKADPQAVLPDVARQAMQAWKCQLDTAMQLVETMTEGAAKIREWQLQAAVDAHANAVATQQAAAKAGDPAELLGTETQWIQRNVEQAASYWRILFETGVETNANLLKCLLAQQQATAGAPAPAIDIDASKGALLEMVESAYSQWLEASKSLIAVPPAAGGSRGKAN